MNISNKMKQHGLSFLLVGSLMILPSCGLFDWVKEKFGGTAPESMTSDTTETAMAIVVQDGSPILATINGKPLITKNMLETEKKKLFEANPQLQAMVALMDEKQLDRNLIDGMTSREIIRKYVADQKISGTDKYKKDLDMIVKQMTDALNTRYFMESFSVAVNNDEVKKFYEANKETIPNLLVSRGGIETVGLPFGDEAQAKEFAIKVRTNKNDMLRTAREAGAASRVKDFRLVNDQSIGIEPALRDNVMAIKATPSVHTFKVGKEYWVIAASKIEKPQYRELDQVKDEIRQLLEKEKTMQRFEQEVVRLRGEYQIELNEDFFKGAADNAQAVQAELNEQNKPQKEKTVKKADASGSAHTKKASPRVI